MFYRRNILKNIVFRRIIEIREIKKKPKLSQILEYFNKQGNKNNKDRLVNKLKLLYKRKDNHPKQHFNQDPKYEKLMSSFDRIQKVLGVQQLTLEQLDKKML